MEIDTSELDESHAALLDKSMDESMDDSINELLNESLVCQWMSQKLSKNHLILLERSALMEVLDDSTLAQIARLKFEVECAIEIVDRIGDFFLLEHQRVEECHCRLALSNQMIVRTFLKRMNRDFC